MRAESAVEPTKVREHHRDLAAFGGILAFGAATRRGDGRSGTGSFAIARSILRRSPRRDAQLLQVLVGQVGKD